MSNSRKVRGGPSQAQVARDQGSVTQGRRVAPLPKARSASRPSGNTLIRPLLLAGAVVVVLLVGWLLYGAFAPVSAPVVPSPQGRIAFVRQNADNTRDLYVVNPDGVNQQKATSNVNIEGGPGWSPDGKQILVQALVNGTSTIVRIDIAPNNTGSNAVQLTADAKGDSVLPVWSPDGNLIAFQSKREGGDYQVFVMDRDGNNKRRLSDGKGYAGQPAWSPDSKTIVYAQGDKQSGSTHDLYVVDLAAGTPKKITPGGKDLSSPRWSPDGKSILYLDNAGDRNNTIMIMNVDGTAPRVLVNQGDNKTVSFSPDGKEIVYYSVAPPAGSDVYIVPVAGGSTQNLTHLSADDYDPTWSLDGKQVAWASRLNGQYRIVVGDVAGAAFKPVSSGDGSDFQPQWGPPLPSSPSK